MIKLMIVDDEVLTRIGIASMYKWSENGFIIVGEADNGRAALEIAEREQPDIILTDIKMPVMDGIELIKEARQRGLKAKFVILSAYNEFEYVREGMKLGAEDYLLKLELEPDKLIELLTRISEKIRTENSTKPSLNTSRKVYKISHEYSKARCIYNILTGWYDTSEDIDAHLKKAGLAIQQENLVLIGIQSKNHAHNRSSLSKADILFSLDNTLLKALNELIKNYGCGYGCMIEKQLYCMVVSLSSIITPAFRVSHCSKIKAGIEEHIRDTFGIALTINTSNPTNDFAELPLLFKQLFIYSAGKYHLNEPGLNIPMQKQESVLNFSFGAELSQIDKILNYSNLDKLDSSFADLIYKIKTSGVIPVKMLHGICHTLIHIIDGFISRNNYLKHNWNRSEELLSLIKKCKTQDEYISYIQSLNKKLIQLINSDNNCKTIILKAKQYIEQNYQKNISLESTALHLNLSPTYLSRLFSKETGESFIDYLTHVRINHAKELIKNTNKKIQEISENTGYNNPYYFSRIFKKVTGVTPLEYRK